MPYAIKYYRDADVVEWYLQHGICDRPEGWVTGTSRFEKEGDAQAEADHINQLGPSRPLHVAKVM